MPDMPWDDLQPDERQPDGPPRDELQWDDTVDVVCLGTGAGALAGAIATVRTGATAFVAGTEGRQPRESAELADATQRLGIRTDDDATNHYLEELTADLTWPSSPAADGSPASAVPVRAVTAPTAHPAPDQPSARGKRRTVIEPFYGYLLRDWAEECVASPGGMVCNRISDHLRTVLRTAAGQEIVVADVGAVGAQWSGGRLTDWLSEQARDQGIVLPVATVLHRLVVTDGHVSGVMVATPAGVCTIQARYGVLVSLSGHDRPDIALNSYFPRDVAGQVALVGKATSRFARLEILTAPS